MAEVQIVKVDEGGVNARILAKETPADFRRVEVASLKMPARFTSAEGKRFFVRHFNTLQLNAHFVSVIARTRLEHDDVAKVEAAIRAQMEAVVEKLNQAIDGAEALFKANGITSVATFDTLPLEVEVGVLSSSGRRYLEVLGKFDQVMPLLQTLEIFEVIDAKTVDAQRAVLKREVRNIANGARNLAMGLRRRMLALNSRPDPELVEDESDAAQEPPTETETHGADEVSIEPAKASTDGVALGAETVEQS